MINKEKLYENISTVCFILAIVCCLMLLACIAVIPLINYFIYFIENTSFSSQELIAIFSCIGFVLFAIVGAIFTYLNWREEENRLEHEFKMQFEKKEN